MSFTQSREDAKMLYLDRFLKSYTSILDVKINS